ncbi:hypothetical protein KIL84_015570 [Mauremys mutica]|uniref:Uncharacterized protein n=1 Tax=Mauremys mutica TaxID=74926 RepID=A0A9D3WTK4_9SAUR|nr:hypothetical protein KIL84_015570 [Mauremys mutica]
MGLNPETCAENTLPQPRDKRLKGLPAPEAPHFPRSQLNWVKTLGGEETTGAKPWRAVQIRHIGSRGLYTSEVPVITIDRIPDPATTWQLGKESSSSHSPGKPTRRKSSLTKSRNQFVRESYNPPGFRPSALGALPCKTSCLMTSPCKQSCGSRKNQRCISPGPGLRAGSFHHRELLVQQTTDANLLLSLPLSGQLRKARLMSLNPVRAKAPDPAFCGLIVAERLWTRPALPDKPVSLHTSYLPEILHYTSLCSLGEEEEDEGSKPQEPRDCRVRKHHLDSNLIC